MIFDDWDRGCRKITLPTTQRRKRRFSARPTREETGHKVLTYVEYRTVSGVFQNIDLPPPVHPTSVSSPRTGHKVLTYIEYRAVSGVFQNIDPPPPLHPASVSSPRTKGRGVHTRRAVRGVGGVNILEDARYWIGLLQYNPSTTQALYAINKSVGFLKLKLGLKDNAHRGFC
jgi:hypothetical protein